MLGTRIKNLRLDKGITQQELASMIGVTSVSIGNWEAGRKKPSVDALASLSDALDVSVDSLLNTNSHLLGRPDDLNRDEYMLITNYRELDSYGKMAVDSICTIELERTRSSPKNKTGRLLRLYTVRPAAGVEAPLDESDYTLTPATDAIPRQADYCVCINGNSMFPYIKDGDIVYVERTETLAPGDVGIFNVDGAIYCKQFHPLSDGTLTLVSANPEFKRTNITIKPDGSSFVKILGRVLLERKPRFPDYVLEETK